MPHPSPTALQSAAQEVGAATSPPVALPTRDRAHPLQARLPLGARRDRGLAELILLIGVAAVAGPLAVAVAGSLVLLAVAAAGPYLLLPIISFAFALLVFLATGAAG